MPRRGPIILGAPRDPSDPPDPGQEPGSGGYDPPTGGTPPPESGGGEVLGGGGDVGAPAGAPADAPPPQTDNNDVTNLPPDLVGDIPPPPIPPPPAIVGPGVGGVRGTEAGTFARPGSVGAMPFRTPSYTQKSPPRFGPGTPMAGGGTTAVQGLGETAGALSPEEMADLLRAMAARSGGGR